MVFEPRCALEILKDVASRLLIASWFLFTVLGRPPGLSLDFWDSSRLVFGVPDISFG